MSFNTIVAVIDCISFIILWGFNHVERKGMNQQIKELNDKVGKLEATIQTLQEILDEVASEVEVEVEVEPDATVEATESESEEAVSDSDNETTQPQPSEEVLEKEIDAGKVITQLEGELELANNITTNIIFGAGTVALTAALGAWGYLIYRSPLLRGAAISVGSAEF